MNITKRISGRIQGYKNDLKSHYWEYTHFYKNAKVDQKAILFESFGGRNFQGNPFYIYKSIFEDKRYGGYKLYIASQNPNELIKYLKVRKLYDSRVFVIEHLSAQYRKVLCTAKYLVNNVSFNMNFIKKQDQVYLNTWHGTPLKYLGKRILNDPFEMNNSQRNFLLCDYLIAPNKFTESVYLDDYMVKGIMPGKVYLQGYPRNSVFFNNEYRNIVRKKYGLQDKKVILYMPTWRGTANGVEKIDVFSEMKKLAGLLGDKYKIFVKLHPAMIGQKKEYSSSMLVPEDCEIYEFCNACDILITDYSSVFFDFANTGKPIILYQYDLENYFKSRGAYKVIQKGLPFPIVYSVDEMFKCIKNIDDIDYSEFCNTFCEYDGIDAAEQAKELLFSKHTKVTQKEADLYVIDFPVSDREVLAYADTLKEKNYRFVFFPKKSNKHFSNLSCFNEIQYLVVYPFDRLNIFEKIIYSLSKAIYFLTKSKKSYNIISTYVEREQKRLWGNMNIGNIYAKKGKKPVAVSLTKEWK